VVYRHSFKLLKTTQTPYTYIIKIIDVFEKQFEIESLSLLVKIQVLDKGVYIQTIYS